jgi:predicted transcriptional regulator
MITRSIKRTRGERSGVLLDDVDLIILKILNKSNKKYSIMELNKELNMSHVSFKIHFRRLINLGFLEKERVEKQNKYLLGLTKKGKELIKLFKK